MNKTSMITALEEVRAYLHRSVDADQYLSPNQELRLQGQLEEIIAELKEAQIRWKL